jgi:hypothetical protein
VTDPQQTLDAHAAWLRGEPGGVRAALSGADLSGADLRGADLRDADLSGAYLSDADLSDAALRGTCLDPDAPLPEISSEAITAAGLTIDGQWVIGRRTAWSQHCGATRYAPGSAHIAPWFSVDATTDCHPGLYLAGAEWLSTRYPGTTTVEVRCLRSELVLAADKWRCRRLWVRCADGSWPEVTGGDPRCQRVS